MTASKMPLRDGSGNWIAAEVVDANVFSPHSVPEVAGAPVSASNPMPTAPLLDGAPISNGNPMPTIGVGMTLTKTKITLAPNTSTAVVAANASRKYLAIQNTGSGLIELAPNTAASVGNGWQLQAAASPGAGGTLIFEANGLSTDAWNAISAAGSTLIVLEGN